MEAILQHFQSHALVCLVGRTSTQVPGRFPGECASTLNADNKGVICSDFQDFPFSVDVSKWQNKCNRTFSKMLAYGFIRSDNLSLDRLIVDLWQIVVVDRMACDLHPNFIQLTQVIPYLRVLWTMIRLATASAITPMAREEAPT